MIMKKHYTYVLQLVLLALFSGTSFHTNAASHSIIDPDNALYQLEWSFIKTLIDEDLERSFERKDERYLTIVGCPDDISVDVDPGTCGAVVTWPTITGDPGNIITQIQGFASGSTFPLGLTNNMFEERDTSGTLIDTCTFSVTVNDNEPPTIALLGDTPQDIEVCDTYIELGVNASDNCSGDITGSVVIDASAVDTAVVGPYTVTYNVTDAEGNPAAEVTRTVNVVDTSIPTITLNGDATMTIEACDTYTEPGATADDGCLAIGAVTIGGDTVNPNVVGTYIVTYNVTDANNNDAIEVTRTVEVVDTTIPTITLNGDATMTLEACGTYSEPGATADDGCLTIGAVTIGGDTVNPNVVGTYIVTYNVTDANNNDAIQVTRTVEVVDTTIPTITLNGDATMTLEACGSYSEPGATADDGCLSIGVVVIGGDTVDLNVVGTYTVTYNVTDNSGNNALELTRIVNVVDTTAPTFTSCPSNFNLSNDLNICGAVVNYTIPTATDNCGTAVVAQTDTSGLTSGSVFPIGITTIEYTATDANGLTSVCSFTVTVSDDELPTIVCPDDVTVSADANCQVATLVLDAPTTDDNCTVASVSNNLAGQLPLPVGTHTVTWTVTDTAGLTATCDQTITVVDDTPPVITCPTPLASYDTDPDQCYSTLSFEATATDNCTGSPTISYEIDGNPISFPYNFPVGSTTVDVFAEDGDGLISTCSFVVNVEDNQPPIALCQPLTVTLGSTGNATITAEALNNGSSDACGGTLTYAASQTSFTCADIGTNNVTLTVTDANGNTSTCNTTVTVNDYIQNATATITSSVASPICSETSVTFEATTSHLGLITMPDYQWYQNGSPVGTNSNTYTTTGLNNNDDVYVEITAGPCNTLITSNNIVMTVSPLLPVSFTLNASANPACTGDNLSFFVTDLTNGGSPSYQWFLNSTPVGTNSNSYSSNAIADGDVISVSVSSSAACANPVPATQSLTMEVTPDRTISLTTGNNNQVICNGSNLADIVYNITNATGATITGVPTGITGTYNNGVYTISGTSSQVGTFNYTVTPIGCGTAAATGTIFVGPDATINVISPSVNDGICNNNTDNLNLQFQLNSGATGASLSSTPSLPASITGSFDSATGIYTVSGTSNQPGIYNYTVTTIGCGPGATISGIITVYDGPPISPTINGNQAFLCVAQEATYSVLLDPNVSNYFWEVSSQLSIASGQGTNEIVITFNSDVTNNETVTVTTSNACGSSSSSINLNINFSVSDMNAGPDIYVCSDINSVQMAGYSGSILTDLGLGGYELWNWSDNGAGGSFSNNHYLGDQCYIKWCTGWFGIPYPCGYNCGAVYGENETSIYTFPPTAQPGDIITISIVAWPIGIGDCPPISSNMQIHILENTDAEIISPEVTICEGSSYDITFSGTPNAEIRYNDGTGNSPWLALDNNGFRTISVTPTATTTYTLNRVRYAPSTYPGNNNCPTVLNQSITVNVNEQPTVTVPNDITICAGTTVNLASATIGGSNAVGSWSTTGTGNFSSGIYTPSASDIINSPITLTYTNTPSDGVCPPVSDSMVVTINPIPTVATGVVSQTICSDTPFALNGSSSTGVTWTASPVNSGTFNDARDPQAYFTPNSGFSGNVTLTLTTDDPAGPCGPNSDNVTLTVNSASIANAGTDLTVCNSGPIALNGSFSGTATSATWSSSTGGTFTPNANTMNATYNPSAADITAGSVTLTLTSSNPAGVCNSGVDTVLFTFNESATADAGTNQTICSTQTLDLSGASFGGSATSATWSSSGTPGTISGTTYTPSAADIANGSVTLTYTTNVPPGVCPPASDSIIVTIIPFVNAAASNTTAITSCSDTKLQLTANGNGTWSATPVTPGSVFSFSSTTNPNATFTGESGAEYTLTWTLTNPAPCAIDADTFTVTLMDCEDNLTFNGIDNSVNFNNTYNLSGNFSIETWIKPNAINGNIQTILSKRNEGNWTTGYDLRLYNNEIQFYANNTSVTRTGITVNRWYHIAVTFDGAAYRLYVDGLLVNTKTTTVSPAPNTANALLGAMSRPNNTPTNYYNGWMDEVRIWNTRLTVDQIRLMMNQEIENDGGNVIGRITGPMVATGLNWSNLIAYYRMNRSSDITGGNLIANAGVNGVLRNMTAPQPESAPVPYVSQNDGDWTALSTWSADNFQQIPNTNGVIASPIEWNIVRTEHNVSSTNKNIKVLGLLVDDNTLSIENSDPNNGQSIEVTKYLKIDGVLDLVGESQLLQPEGSIVDYTGTGYLERDQQGTGNMFNYNYWGSPVTNAETAGERTYSLAGILYDGNDPVQWTGGLNGSTSPVTLSTRWLYTFENRNFDDYNGWRRITQNTAVDVGLGFLMKGTGAQGSPDQNYTFRGQPNNGDIIVTIGPAAPELLTTLIGNPYPSAIDANAFINDNESALYDGTLVFWEQAPSNNSHYLAAYQGRYSYYNISGGISSTTPPEIAGDGNAIKTPTRAVAVGQGFFVEGKASGGDVIFKNSQRLFAREAGGGSVFFRNTEDSTKVSKSQDDAPLFEDNIQRVRLAFTTPENATRHLLLAFTPDDDATDGIDYGYDASNSDDFPSDLSFAIQGRKFVIQGVGAFDINKKYPLDMTVGVTGNVAIALTELENFDEDIDVYVHDALLDTYTRINTVSFQANLEKGNYNGRFSIVFQPDTTLDIIDQDFKDISVKYLQKTDEIYVKTPASIEVRQVYLINIAGQAVRSWNMTNMNFAQEFKIPVKNISEGNYVLKVETNTNSYNKKVIIKF